MILYPAIDIRGGRSVRLFQGDYEQETVFDIDPADAAARWADAGARWLHVVDLDAARAGRAGQSPALARIRDCRRNSDSARRRYHQRTSPPRSIAASTASSSAPWR